MARREGGEKAPRMAPSASEAGWSEGQDAPTRKPNPLSLTEYVDPFLMKHIAFAKVALHRQQPRRMLQEADG